MFQDKKEQRLAMKVYSLFKDKDVVFYLIKEKSILILRILHEREDLPKHFK